MLDLEKSEKTLNELELVIERGLEEFHRVGLALLEIRERKLFQPEFNSFEEYCNTKWNMSLSMSYHLSASASVMDSLEGEVLPSRSSYAAKLYVIKDEDLRNRAWNDILSTNLEITGSLVEKYAKKYWLVEKDKEFGDLVLRGEITPDHAIDVYKKLRILPTYYREIYLKYPTIDVDCLTSLRQFENDYPDEFMSIIQTGILDNGRDSIPLAKLSGRDIDALWRRLKWEESQLKREVQSEIQIAEIQKQGLLILDGIDVMEGLVEHSGGKNLVYIFPEQAYSLSKLAEVLEKYDYETLVIGVYTKNNEPDMRLHGNTFIKPSMINGVKPDYLIRAFEQSVYQ